MDFYLPIKRGTILLPSGPGHNPDQKHLFVICTEQCSEGNHLLAGITTWRNDRCDATCILEAGVHGFIRDKSFVLYGKTRIEGAQTLIKGVEKEVFFTKAAIQPEHFERICAGICDSPHTPNKMKKYYEENS